jgi:TolB-like protein
MFRKWKRDDCLSIFVTVAVLLLLALSVSGFAQQSPAADPVKVNRSHTVPTVAVFDFFQDGPPGSQGNADLSELISMLLLDNLYKQGSVNIVERKKLAEVMAELNLGTTMIADLDTKLRLGRFLGADYFVFGSYLYVGNQVLISAHLVNTQSGLIVKAADMDGDKQQVQSVVNRLAIKLLGGFRAASEDGGR